MPSDDGSLSSFIETVHHIHTNRVIHFFFFLRPLAWNLLLLCGRTFFFLFFLFILFEQWCAGDVHLFLLVRVTMGIRQGPAVKGCIPFQQLCVTQSPTMRMSRERVWIPSSGFTWCAARQQSHLLTMKKNKKIHLLRWNFTCTTLLSRFLLGNLH